MKAQDLVRYVTISVSRIRATTSHHDHRKDAGPQRRAQMIAIVNQLTFALRGGLQI